MPGLSATTQTLSAAVAELPAKPRVHELARLSGQSSKEIITALAEAGVQVKAASSSVDREVAVALLSRLLAADGGDEPSADNPSPDGVGAEAAGADTPAGASVAPPTGLMGLFLEPEPAPAPRTRRKASRGAGAADADLPIESGAADGSSVPPSSTASSGITDGVTTRSPRQRRRKGADAPDESASAELLVNLPSGEPEPTREPSAKGTRSRSAAKGAGKRAAAPAKGDGEQIAPAAEPATDGAEAEPDLGLADSDLADADLTDADVDADGGRRRRRRGRRGRGRPAEADDAGQGDGPTGAAGTDGAADQDVSGDSAEPDEDGALDTDEADDTPAGSRRRRRRRRRGGSAGEDGGREDDPDDTVVHVRDARSADSEVQGIKGSTRLEAKRQRRRDTRDSRRRPQILTEAEFLARRESVDRVMAVRQRGGLAQVALLEDGMLVEHFVSQAGSASMIGNIYLGRVQNVLPSMEAAFVDIGRGRNAVLYAGEVNWDATGLQGKARKIETALASGDTVLVQVSKDPVGHKGARLTTQIALPGRFLVYVPGGGATGISRKLPDTERRRLKAILDAIVPADAGVIIRTAAEGVPEEELARDVERLKAQWEQIQAIADPDSTAKAAGKTRKPAKVTAPQQLSAEPDTLIKVVRDLFNSDINQLVIDGDQAWESVSSYVQQVAPELADRVVRFGAGAEQAPDAAGEPDKPARRGRRNASAGKAAGDVFTAYRVDEQIAKALERKVHLPSGGSLVIDRTEAMTVVDVNTGKFTGSGGNLEETVTRNNLEAAEEIVRQLRLRDIGGIIVIDFIDMVLESNRDLVLRRLTECLGRDRTRHQVAEVTSLGLVQMTRKRMGTGLVEAFSETCEHCHGRGIVLKDAPADHSHAGDDDDRSERDRSGARKRRDRRREADTPDAPIARIVTPKADPRGPKPPLRPGAPIRAVGSSEPPPAGQETDSADGVASAAAADARAAADEMVSDPSEVSREVADAVAAVIDGPVDHPLIDQDDIDQHGGGHHSDNNGQVPDHQDRTGLHHSDQHDGVDQAGRSVSGNDPAPAAKGGRPRRRRAASRPAGAPAANG